MARLFLLATLALACLPAAAATAERTDADCFDMEEVAAFLRSNVADSGWTLNDKALRLAGEALSQMLTSSRHPNPAVVDHAYIVAVSKPGEVVMGFVVLMNGAGCNVYADGAQAPEFGDLIVIAGPLPLSRIMRAAGLEP